MYVKLCLNKDNTKYNTYIYISISEVHRITVLLYYLHLQPRQGMSSTWNLEFNPGM